MRRTGKIIGKREMFEISTSTCIYRLKYIGFPFFLNWAICNIAILNSRIYQRQTIHGTVIYLNYLACFYDIRSVFHIRQIAHVLNL